MAEVVVTKENFENEVINSEIPVIVDFWAEWCGPCRMLAPILKEVADEFDGKVKVAKVNVDNDGELAEKYKIISIPTLIVFSKGEQVKKSIGYMEKSEVVDLFSSLI